MTLGNAASIGGEGGRSYVFGNCGEGYSSKFSFCKKEGLSMGG